MTGSSTDAPVVNMLVNEMGEDELLATAERTVVIRAAMDSGSAANVVHPDDLPAGVRSRRT